MDAQLAEPCVFGVRTMTLMVGGEMVPMFALL